MSRVSKPSRRLLGSLDNAALHDESSVSDPSSDSEFSSSSLSSSSKSSDDHSILTTSKPCNEDDALSSEEEEPSPKRHKILGGTVSRVKKKRGPGKKNKTAVHSETTKQTITYHLSIFSTVAKPKTKHSDPKSDFF
ncbi:hypothetical protein L208DRAFT_1413821 [Tricholoma matsutake]|nr:hypothetical protein L208DRAFT_1413821 [Tricholoma matsutake 945]